MLGRGRRRRLRVTTAKWRGAPAGTRNRTRGSYGLLGLVHRQPKACRYKGRAGEVDGGAHLVGSRSGCSVRRRFGAGTCRGRVVPSCNAVAGVRAPARRSSGGGGDSLLLLLPYYVSSPSSPLLAATVEGETPGALGFRGDSRGVYVGGALGFWPGRRKGTAVTGQTRRGMRGSIRAAPWLGFSSAGWSGSARGGPG